MRKYFELSCKIIGLLLICYGTIVLFVGAPLVIGTLPGLMPQRNGVQWHANLFLVWTLLSCGALPVSMGIYLMRSNNLVVRLCYPERTDHTQPPTSGTLSLNLPRTEKDEEKPEDPPDDKYAPPGYLG